MITNSSGFFLRLPLLCHSKEDDSTQFIEQCAYGHTYLYNGSSHVTQHHVTMGNSHYDRITSHYSTLVCCNVIISTVLLATKCFSINIFINKHLLQSYNILHGPSNYSSLLNFTMEYFKHYAQDQDPAGLWEILGNTHYCHNVVNNLTN